MENTLGSRIAKYRKQKGFKQDQLAEALNVSPQAVSKWETGDSFPDIVLLPQIADIFGVSVDYLLRGKPVTRQQLEIGSADWTFAGSINDKYLADGWIITDMKFAADSEGGMGCAVVMEKEFFEE